MRHSNDHDLSLSHTDMFLEPLHHLSGRQGVRDEGKKGGEIHTISSVAIWLRS